MNSLDRTRRSARTDPNTHMCLQRSPSSAWLAGFLGGVVPVVLLLRWTGIDPLSNLVWLAFSALGLSIAVFGLESSTSAGPQRCAATAGAWAGMIAGIALAQPTPTRWFMSDVAWHTAKVTLVASGHPLEDPILRAPTIYPFLFHFIASWPVMLGATARTVMWAVTPLALGLAQWAFWWMARAWCAERAAAWTAIALPLVFYAPREGFALLPNPFNASLGLVFLGLGAWSRGSRSENPRQLFGAGLSLGMCGLLWYGHLSWLVISTAVWGWRHRRGFVPLALGASPAALLLVLHLGLLSAGGLLGSSAIVKGAPSEALMERLAGMGRNLLTLSGGAPLTVDSAWLGLFVLGLAVLALRRRSGQEFDASGVFSSVLLVMVVCLAGAGFWLTFWQPFSWRYAFLAYALVLCFIGTARPWSFGRREIGPIHIASAACFLWAPACLLPMISVSQRIQEKHEATGLDVVRFLESRTSIDEPVFASVDTWDIAIGCCVPRPNLVARNAGSYNFAPGCIALPRWRIYTEIEMESNPTRILDLLRPFGFRYAIVGNADLSKPGFRSLSEAFECALANDEYRIVDLSRRKP